LKEHFRRSQEFTMKLQLKPLFPLSMTALSMTALSLATLVVTGCLATFEPEEEETDAETVAPGDGDSNPSTGGVNENSGNGAGGTTESEVCPAEPCSSGGTGGDSTPDTPSIEVSLPVIVTDVFAPSGFMGADNSLAGHPNETMGIVMDESGCDPAERPSGAAGACFAISYSPQYLPPCTEAQLQVNPDCTGGTWAGVYFQNPSLNWGEFPGVLIEPGATKVVFTAWTTGEEIPLKFLAGGLGSLSTAYRDTFHVETAHTIGPTPTQFELNLSSASYERVLGGFGWTISVSSDSPMEFFLDDIRWVTD
jgi:hypothetical protein